MQVSTCVQDDLLKGGMFMKNNEKQTVSFIVNNEKFEFSIGTKNGEVPPSETLAQTLRERLELTGLKIACDHGGCGCCTVIMDGDAVASCMLLTSECGGKNITTIEGLENANTGELDPLQQTFIDNAAFQCGFCTPGILMASKALLDKNPSASEEEIEEALSGNFCRCGSHHKVMDSLLKMCEKGGECKCQKNTDI